jgi:hypothetical protein
MSRMAAREFIPVLGLQSPFGSRLPIPASTRARQSVSLRPFPPRGVDGPSRSEYSCSQPRQGYWSKVSALTLQLKRAEHTGAQHPEPGLSTVEG